MRISLLDPGLAQLGGHHFDLDLRLVRALARRGHDVTVHGFVSPSPELAAMAKAAGMALHATFRVHPYHRLPEAQSAIDAYHRLVNVTVEDLAGVPQTDLWIWPTLVPYQFMAAILQARPVRQIGGVWHSPRFPVPIGARCWARAARRVAEAHSPVIVGAYDELLCELYQSFSPGLPIARLPCPHDGAPNDRRPSALRRVGFFGHQRVRRGLDLMPQLVKALLERGFEVLVQDSSGTVHRQGGEDPRLIVLPFVADFPAEIARCDVVIWPSQWEAYVESFSGVVSECIATGVPVIMPSGCLPAKLASRFGCGIFFHEYSCDAILEAVDEAAERFPALVAQAHAAATAWRAVNGTDRLVDWIEAHSAGS
jgi:glycosyltransferase involved in cell wall biosynthesis